MRYKRPLFKIFASTISVFAISSVLSFSLVPLPQGFASVIHRGEGSFHLQPGDRLEVTVYREEDLSGVYEIDPSGILAFPLLGEIDVNGLRMDELLDRLTWNLKKYLINPHVTVSRAEGTIKSISVLGHVKEPDIFDYSPGITLMRVISQAGGFMRSSNKRKIRIVRTVDGTKEVFVVNANDIINGKQNDPRVEPGDMIFIPESIF